MPETTLQNHVVPGPNTVRIGALISMTTVTTKAPEQIAINDIGSAEDFLAAVELTLVREPRRLELHRLACEAQGARPPVAARAPSRPTP